MRRVWCYPATMPAQERKTVTTSVRMTAEQRELIKKAALREAQAILAKADDGR
jgi:uncharacterized protein (DUF1778 family)